VVAAPEQGVDFFLAHFSSSGDRLSLINAPPLVVGSLGANLRAALPRKVAADRVSEDDVLVIELKKSGYGGEDHPLGPIHTVNLMIIAISATA